MSDYLERRVAMLERMVERLLRRDTPHALGRSTMAADDSGPYQKVQVRIDALTVSDDVPLLYHHGFFSSPPIGSDFHISYLEMNRAKAIITASNHQTSRFTGASPGDAGLYAQGMLIHLTASGIVIIGASAQTGDQNITGNQTTSGYQHAAGAIIAGYGGGDQVGLQTHYHTSIGSPPVPGS